MMKKRGVLVLFILFSFSVFADFEVHNMTVEDSYPFNQNLKGEINITIDNLDSDTIFKTSRGHNATLFELLDLNSAIYECVPADCSTGYKIIDSGSTLTLPLNIGESKIFGFYINGSRVDYPELYFKASSNFEEGPNSPLKIKFLESSDNVYRFTNFSEEPRAVRSPNYGYYNSGYSEISSGIIGKTVYCSELWVHETDRIQVGVDLEVNNGTGELIINMYNDEGYPIFEDEDSLVFDPSEGENGDSFETSKDSPFSSGYYYFCLRAKEGSSDYRLYVDKTSGQYSSFSYRDDDFDFNYDAAEANRTKTYAIYVQEAIYADAKPLSQINFSSYLEDADDYLEEKYSNDCSYGCFFPMEIYSSVEQDFKITGPRISYWLDRATDEASYDIYEVEKIPAKIFFSGTLDLGVLDFKMNQSGKYYFYIGKDEDFEKIHSETIDITSAPVILDIYPNYVPAGIKARLLVDIDYDGSESLSYEWEFGDSSTQTTSTNTVYHLFNNISEYNVKVTVTAGDLTNTYEKIIETISPEVYVKLIYGQLSLSLNNSIDEIKTFPSWIQPILEKSLNVLDTEDELKRIKREIDKATDEEDFLEIAQEINNLDLPYQVFISEDFHSDFPITEIVNLDGLSEYLGSELESGKEDEYDNAVALWQNENVEFSVDIQKISLARTSGSVEDILETYLINVNEINPTFDDEYFLVLDIPRDQLTFKSSTLNKEPKSYGQTTIFPIDGGTLTIEFYVLGDSEFGFFATPDIKDLELNVDINENCNFNYICEEGEDYKTCRSDCKPLSLMIFYIILAVFLMLILYTIIQVWYLKYYENILFKRDKNRLYNLLMFVTAAQMNGMNREEIKKALREKGWTSERITYVIKKANGERIGLYEIIPVSKLLAISRHKRVIKNQGMPLRKPVFGGGDPFASKEGHYPITSQPRPLNNSGPYSSTPFNQQQNKRNINKDYSQENNKRK